DSILLTLSSLFARDVYGNITNTKNDSKQLLVGKIFIPVIALLAFLFAQSNISLIAVLSVAASAGLLVIVPSIIVAFFWMWATATGLIVSVTVSGLLVIYMKLSNINSSDWVSGL